MRSATRRHFAGVRGSTRYLADADAVLPAASFAVHVTVCLPIAAVDGVAHDCDATPDPASVAWAVAVAGALRTTGFGSTTGASAGAVRSTRTSTLVVAVRCATSVTVPETWMPAEGVSVEMVFAAGHDRICSTPAHMNVTVTGVRLQAPAA